jgi:hypothetical protein
VEIASQSDELCWNDRRNEVSTVALGKEGHVDDENDATGRRRHEESRKDVNTAADQRSLCYTANYVRTKAVITPLTPPRLDTGRTMNDDRDITAEQLHRKVSESNNLSPQQQDNLYEILVNYLPHLTKRPGKCTQFEYEFQVEGSVSASGHSRPIPFALREQVRDQIQVMLQDDILEESFSDYLNPLTLVIRDMKPLRICDDARRVNQQTVADRTKVLPLR